MPLLALNNVIEIGHYNRLGDQLGVNVRHFGVIAITGSMGIEDLPNLWFTNVHAQYVAILSDAAEFRGVAIRRIVGGNTLQYFSTTAAEPGTATGGPLPLAASGIITLRSDTPGRNARGRLYAPFPSIDDNVDGHPLDNYVDRLGDLANRFLGVTTITSGGNNVQLRSLVYSRKLAFSYPVTVVVPKKKWATMHPRGDFGQANPSPF